MESRFFSYVIILFLLFSIYSTPPLVLARTSKCKFPAIFNFGDSNSDTGGLSAVFGQAPPPHGMSYFGGPAGRYCDGRLVVDFIGPVPTLTREPMSSKHYCLFLWDCNCSILKSSDNPPTVSQDKPNTLVQQKYLISIHFNFGPTLKLPTQCMRWILQCARGYASFQFNYCKRGPRIRDSEGLGLPFMSAYLDSVGSDFAHGANFATAGSTVRPQNTTLQQSGFSPISLDVQWNEFYDFHRRSQIVRNHSGIYTILLPKFFNAYKRMPKREDFSSALYTFDIGQNDLTAGYFSNMTTDEVRAIVPDVVTQLTNIIRYIYGKGGRNFWIHNTGPVGCLPYVIERMPVLASQVDEVGCATPFNEVAQYFNSKLKEAVVKLRKVLPKAALTYVDIYSVKYALFHQGHKHGFNQSLRTCCGHGGRYNFNLNVGCGGTKMVNGKQVLVGKACHDPEGYVVWDGVHFTQAANKFIYDQIAGGAYSDPPISLHMACNRVE